MKKTLLIFTVLFLLLYPSSIFNQTQRASIKRHSQYEKYSDVWVYADNSAQKRCRNKGCMVEVSVAKTNTKEYAYNKSSHVLSVYFSENGSDIDTKQASKIKEFINKKAAGQRVIVAGHTDGCGSFNENKKLAEERIRSVKKIVYKANPIQQVTTKNIGESSAGHDPRSRTVTISINTLNKTEVIYPEIVADFYIIDASGSMSGEDWNIWTKVIANSKPWNARVFVSTTRYLGRGQKLTDVTPGGGTEIWLTYWYVLDKMQPGQTLAIISDFDSTIPLTAGERQRIDEKVRSRGVKVIAIQL